jgi:biotin carboxylase
VVPEATPPFEPLDPRARRHAPRLAYPFFVKPVKGTMSIRARMVEHPGELRAALTLGLRERLEKLLLLRPYGQLLARYSDGEVPAHWFIAEGPLRGVQVTVDGFVQHGRAVVMGVVDSVMYPGTMSFARFEYPSRLPAAVQQRMSDIARRLVEGAGFDASCFNIEMFWDEARDAIHVIEINPRMSYQFGDLYARVDGTHTYAIQLALATGTPAPWRRGAGRAAAAASLVLRRFADARVVRVPGPADIARVADRFPGTTVKVLCETGKRLSQYDQDVGSYRYGIVNMDAPSREELLARWDEARRMLPFEFA